MEIVMQNEIRVGGVPLAEWRKKRQRLDAGLQRRYHELYGQLGVFVVSLNGKDMYIGCGTQIRFGLGKRLFDYVRESDSARDDHSGRLIHQHRDQVAVDIITTGSDRAAAQVAKELKRAFLAAGKPPWNVRRSRR
jgi:hypothetical protein